MDQDDHSPKIVADFEFNGAKWLVVFWPAGSYGLPEEFVVYLADAMWGWMDYAVDLR
jgi:hypothetical protein